MELKRIKKVYFTMDFVNEEKREEENEAKQEEEEGNNHFITLRSSVERTMANSNSDKTLSAYAGSLRQMERSLQRRLFMTLEEKLSYPEGEARDAALGEIEPATMDELLEFIASRRIECKMSKSSVQQFKSACIKYREVNDFEPFTAEDHRRFKQFVRGVTREISIAIQNGDVDAEDGGKRHLKVEEYTGLCRSIYSNFGTIGSIKNDSEIHLFLVLTWALCARSDTTTALHSASLDWEGDCLKVGIAKSKKNYNTVKVWYHVYANPLEPCICPVLSLALHLVCNRNVLTEGEPLFRNTGTRQQAVATLFSKMAEQFLGHKEIGCHSIRKGAATHANTGTPDAPPTFATQIRMRWDSAGQNGTLHKRYIKFGAAGDQYVGRILSCLPQQSPKFAVVAPHFAELQGEEYEEFHNLVERACRDLYGDVKFEGCRRVLPYLVASLVYHIDFIRGLPEYHPVFKSALFTVMNLGDIDILKAKVTIHESEKIKARGLPGNIVLLRDTAKAAAVNQERQVKILEKMDQVLADLSAVNEILPLKGAAAGTIYGENQLKRLRTSLEESIRTTLGELRTDLVGNSQATKHSPSFDTEIQRIHFDWDDGFGPIRNVPLSFEFPRAQAKAADLWMYWWTGMNVKGVVNDEMKHTRLMSFKRLLSDKKLRREILDAYRARHASPNTAKRAVNEMQKLMEYFEEACPIPQLEKLIIAWRNNDDLSEIKDFAQDAWNLTWEVIGQRLHDVHEEQQQMNPEKRLRKHDINRLGARTIIKKLKVDN